jgi:hypothetical protein
MNRPELQEAFDNLWIWIQFRYFPLANPPFVVDSKVLGALFSGLIIF